MLVNLMGLAVCLLVAVTVIGLVELWPRGTVRSTAAFSTVHTDEAAVDDVRTVKCAQPGAHNCRRVSITLLGGKHAGNHSAFTIVGQVTVLALHTGDHIRVYANNFPKGAVSAPGQKADAFSFSDFDRRMPMLWLAIGFVGLLLLTGRFHGLRALAGLAASMLVVVKFVIPAILHGRQPVEVAIVGALAVMLLTMPLSYGLGAKMISALLGTALSLLLAAGLANAFAGIAHLSGASSDVTLYLAATQQTISLRGLLVAGMVIGALGVLVDLTVSQSSTVIALRRANPQLGFAGLFRSALDVGHDHISATVNTLVFAYAGATLPVLLIFTIGHTSFADAINGEAVAEEVIAALIGSIGLIVSMPLTTALAALLAGRLSQESLAADHGHVHAH
ncbi:MAG: hypothetical protein QOI27_1200 [Gaiellaceae bacterium]|jgi:uncharacterized membrane protein|nr:hypothetical protein [Gaiellaceae bacterium]